MVHCEADHGLGVVAAIASVMASELWSPFPPQSRLVDVVLGATASGVVGVGAVRHPLKFLTIVLVLWGCASGIDHGFNSVTLSAQGGAVLSGRTYIMLPS